MRIFGRRPLTIRQRYSEVLERHMVSVIVGAYYIQESWKELEQGISNLPRSFE
jgi:hypothetical protein